MNATEMQGGRTPLHLAVEMENLNMATHLVKKVGGRLLAAGGHREREAGPGGPSSWPRAFLHSWEQTSTAGPSLGTPPCTWRPAWAPPRSPSCSSKQVRCRPSPPAHGRWEQPLPCSGGLSHPSPTGADVLNENDEPISPSSSEASSDTDADPEEQEVGMELGEPSPATPPAPSPQPDPEQEQEETGPRPRRCHTPLDLTRSQKVCGGHSMGWGPALHVPGSWDVLFGVRGDAHVPVSVPQVRDILLQASQPGPEAELPAAPHAGEQPLCPAGPGLAAGTGSV